MKVLVAKIAANAVARVRPAVMAALVAAVNVVPVVRAARAVVAPKALARVDRVAMDLGLKAKVVRGVVFLAMIVVIRAIKSNGASRCSRCRKSLPQSFRTKRASNPWLAR